MNSLFETIFYVLFLYALFILGVYLLNKLVGSGKEKRKKSKIKKITEEDLDRNIKMKEMDEIEKENFKALGVIKIFLSEESLDNKFLREVIIPELNRNSPASEQLPLNLSDKKLRKTIQEKAEEYYTTNDPLLEILAEAFMTRKDKH